MSNIFASIAWTAHVMPFIAWAACVKNYASAVSHALFFSLLASALAVIVQKHLFLDHGMLPFVEMYDMPGYWSVFENQETIVTYIRRPFGWYPEPSFMAGTLALGVCAYVLLKGLRRKKLSLIDWILFGFVAYALFVSRSGSSAVTLGLLTIVLFWPRSLTRMGRFVLLPAAIAALIGARLLIASRSATTLNYSWDDRLSSIVAGFRYLFEKPELIFSGVGKGNATVLAADQSFDYSDLEAIHVTADIVSVTGRLVVENGLLGFVAVILLCFVIFQAFRKFLGIIAACSVVGIWMVVSFLTISYDSATLIWALPGACLGVLSIRENFTIDSIRIGNTFNCGRPHLTS